MLQKLNGYKTYILCAIVIIYNLAMLVHGSQDANTTFENCKTALIGVTLRHGIEQNKKAE